MVKTAYTEQHWSSKIAQTPKWADFLVTVLKLIEGKSLQVGPTNSI